MLLSVKRTYLPAVLVLCPGITDANVLAALIDFVFNLGGGNLRASTLRRKINARDWAGARRELMKWIHGGGRVLPGLVARRGTEASMLPAG